jgi:hypothetical protein
MLEYNAQYAGFIFGDAWGKVSASSHCQAAKARYAAGKKHYKSVNIQQQIAKFCEEARMLKEQDDILFGTGGAGGTGTAPASTPSNPYNTPPPGYAYNPPAPPPPVGGGEEEGGIGLAVPLGILGVLAVAGIAGIFLLPKKKKTKKNKKGA